MITSYSLIRCVVMKCNTKSSSMVIHQPVFWGRVTTPGRASERYHGLEQVWMKVPVLLWVSRLSFTVPNLGSAKDQEPECDGAVSVEAARIGSDVDGAQGETHIDQPMSSTNVVVYMVEEGTTYLHNPGEEEDNNNTLEPHVPTIDCKAFAPLKDCHLVHIRSGIRRQRVGTSFREDSNKARQGDGTSR